jgi:hypothetical protein
MSPSALTADISLHRGKWRDGPTVLQNDFEPRSAENFFQIKVEQGILIQEFNPLDSNIARFCRSDEVPPMFATQSARSGLTQRKMTGLVQTERDPLAAVSHPTRKLGVDVFTQPGLKPDVAARRFWIASKPETHLFLAEACSIALSCGAIANAN